MVQMYDNDGFFNKGDVVMVSHIPSPEMVVIGIVRNDDALIGIRCFWFGEDLSYNEQVFNTKDLTKTKK
jgi:hypothetical protein